MYRWRGGKMRPYRRYAGMTCLAVAPRARRGRFGVGRNPVRLPSRCRQAGYRHRCSPELPVRAGRPRGSLAGARLVARLPIRGTHSADGAGPGGKPRYRHRHGANPAGRCAGADRRGRIAAADRSQRQRDGHQDVAATRYRRRQHPRRWRRGVAVLPALYGVVERELHRRLLGQEPGDVESERGNVHGEPIRSRGRYADRHRVGRRHLLPGIGGAGSPAHCAPQSHRCHAHPRPDQAAVRRRNVLRSQCRAAGEPGRTDARGDPDLRAASPAKYRGARRAGRAHAGTLHRAAAAR